MKKANWTLNVDESDKDYLKETKEYIYRLKSDLISKILNSPKKNGVIEINSMRYNQAK